MDPNLDIFKVEGRTFRQWFIHEYMVSNDTLLHRHPETGRVCVCVCE